MVGGVVNGVKIKVRVCFIFVLNFWLQRINGDGVEEIHGDKDEWDDSQSDEQAKPMWITDNKNNIKYEITQVNYAQVVKIKFINNFV